MSDHIIKSETYTISEIISLSEQQTKLALSNVQIEKINKNRKFLEGKINQPEAIYYGINTGFGSLCNERISHEDLSLLQTNLVRSHACGSGYILDEKLCRLIFLMKILNLSKAYSGVRSELVQHMINVYNAGIIPVIYEQGSLGASGDLAPLAHLSLTLIGEGKCYYKNDIISSNEALKNSNINAITLEAKEGLALLNGTQFSLSHAIFAVDKARRLYHQANKNVAVAMEAFACSKQPYHPLVGKIRNSKSQSKTAAEILALVNDSQILDIEKYSVQDPYSFRCVPQVHGASLTAIEHAEEIISAEINAVTDNPNIADEEGLIISAGNFHAQNLALILDYLSIAISELGSISERRTYLLINGERKLPSYLTPNPGLNSGLMIAQYTAASIASQNKQLCTPTSIDSIVSSKGQEDHVSMAANGATRIMKLCDNVHTLLSIELLCGMQALDFRGVERASSFVKEYHQRFRKNISFMDEDRVVHDDILGVREFINI